MVKAKTYVLHPVTIYSHTSTVPTLWPVGELGSTSRLSLAIALVVHGAGAYTVCLAWAVALLGAGVRTSELRPCVRTMPDRARNKRPPGAALPALAAPRPVA